MKKLYVEVIVKYNLDGSKIPLQILWDDGRVFDIERIYDIRKAASLKSGGHGLRYTCMIKSTQRYLFLDDNKWFIEC